MDWIRRIAIGLAIGCAIGAVLGPAGGYFAGAEDRFTGVVFGGWMGVYLGGLTGVAGAVSARVLKSAIWPPVVGIPLGAVLGYVFWSSIANVRWGVLCGAVGALTAGAAGIVARRWTGHHVDTG